MEYFAALAVAIFGFIVVIMVLSCFCTCLRNSYVDQVSDERTTIARMTEVSRSKPNNDNNLGTSVAFNKDTRSVECGYSNNVQGTTV